MKKVVDALFDFASNHGQIKSWGFGDFYHIDTVKDRLYPCMWITPVPSTLTNTQMNDTYQIAVFDALDEDDNINELDVLSDTREILIDVVRYFWNNIYQEELGFVLDERSSTLIPFDHRFDITCAGHYANMTFISDMPLNQCSTPTD